MSEAINTKRGCTHYTVYCTSTVLKYVINCNCLTLLFIVSFLYFVKIIIENYLKYKICHQLLSVVSYYVCEGLFLSIYQEFLPSVQLRWTLHISHMVFITKKVKKFWDFL